MGTNYSKYILSTGTHYISNSGSDESGNLHGGKAGDQTGREWQLRAWYKRPWTAVLRWPDINVGTLIAQLAIDAALNNKIGYDQWQRDTFWRECKKVGYLPGKITTACEEDCTAGVNGIVHCAAYLLGISAIKKIPETGVRSGNMRVLFKGAGFKVLTDSKYLSSPNYLLPGDILLYDGHHAATNVTRGSKVSYTYHDVIDNLPEYKTDGAVRALHVGDEGAEVKKLQQSLITLGYSCGRWGADGDFGDATELALKQFQQDHGLTADGEYGAKTKAAMDKALADHERPIEEPSSVEIVGGNCYVRSAPKKDARALGVAHEGDRLPYDGQTSENGWHLVQYKGQNGWVSGKYSKVVG